MAVTDAIKKREGIGQFLMKRYVEEDEAVERLFWYAERPGKEPKRRKKKLINYLDPAR